MGHGKGFAGEALTPELSLLAPPRPPSTHAAPSLLLAAAATAAIATALFIRRPRLYCGSVGRAAGDLAAGLGAGRMPLKPPARLRLLSIVSFRGFLFSFGFDLTRR